MSDLQHTPTPWSIGKRRWVTSGDVDIARIHSVSKIGEAEAVANAEFIIRACNSYYALLTAIQEVLYSYEDDSDTDLAIKLELPMEDLQAALAKARGEVTNEN